MLVKNWNELTGSLRAATKIWLLEKSTRQDKLAPQSWKVKERDRSAQLKWNQEIYLYFTVQLMGNQEDKHSFIRMVNHLSYLYKI